MLYNSTYNILYLSATTLNEKFLTIAKELSIEHLGVNSVMDALDYLMDHSVDAILIDESIEDDNVVLFLSYMNDDVENRETPVIISTSQNHEEELSQKVADFNVVSILSNSNWYKQATKLFDFLHRHKIDVKSIKSNLEKSEDRGVTDQLTGALNRYGCEDVFYKLTTRLEAYQEPFSMFMLDIDHFKSVNDTYGHDVGDEVLVGFAKIIKDSIRKDDYLVRLGGEEFIVFLSHTTLEIAVKIAEKIRTIIEQAAHSSKNLTVTASFGVVDFAKGLSLEEMQKRADVLLYKAKSEGRNRVLY